MDQDILVTRATLPPLEEYIQEIKEIWDTHWLTNMGPKHEQFEKSLKDYMNVVNLELFTNGHMALELLLQAMELSGEVITTPFTFASTTHAIVRNGLTPVFCDIHPDNYTIDETKIEELITEKTSAVLAVHVYGNICNVEKLQEIADKHHIKLIYDAAHAFGVSYRGKSIAQYGDASMFSFHATKVFNSIEGGAVCYQDEKLGKKLYQLKNFGIKNQEEVDGIGANAKMNEFQAAMGICNLRHLQENIKQRQKIVRQYFDELAGIPGIILSEEDKEILPNYAYFPVRVKADWYGMDRDALVDKLASNKIYARKYFYPLTSEYACYQGEFVISETPIAQRVSREILTLPLYPDMDEKTVHTICQIIRE
ncbi:MAG: DegT/DnrJ/EryC1/StrS family aminotransferase [Lachnospiraceae bacterium]|nr:DegT/DnrJ/EryC1/StrS family aminotransferase [Lachnospiraceae bacterium]